MAKTRLNFSFNLKTLKPVSYNKLYCMEKSLFSSIKLISWRCDDIQIDSGLSRGGGGVLYTGTYQNRKVAIKLPSLFAIKKNDKPYIEELEQEYECCRSLGRIDGIPACRAKVMLKVAIGAGAIARVPLIIFDFVEGVPLSHLINKPIAMTADDKLKIFKKLVEILISVHQVGVVHKDINPGNVLVDFSAASGDVNKIWLLDFGASMQARRFVPQYGSPEQHMPIAYGKVQQQSDIFSLALTIFALFEKRLPFVEQNAAKSIAEEKPFELDFQFEENEVLAPILEKMLRKDPKNRYPNMAAVYQDISELASFASEPP